MWHAPRCEIRDASVGVGSDDDFYWPSRRSHELIGAAFDRKRREEEEAAAEAERQRREKERAAAAAEEERRRIQERIADALEALQRDRERELSTEDRTTAALDSLREKLTESDAKPRHPRQDARRQLAIETPNHFRKASASASSSATRATGSGRCRKFRPASA